MSDFTNFYDPYDGAALKKSPKVPDKKLYGMNVAVRNATIKSIDKLNHDTVSLVVKYRGHGEDIKPKAGQYATLKPDHLVKPRAYSFARAPHKEKPGEHTFLIRLMDGGLFSSWLFEKDRVNEPLTLTGPIGKFGLDNSDKLILCIAGGSGMSAIYAILEDAAHRQVARSAMFFLWRTHASRPLFA